MKHHALILAFALTACGGPSDFRLADDAPVADDAPEAAADAPAVPADAVAPDAPMSSDVVADATTDTFVAVDAPPDVVVDRTVADAQNDAVDAADVLDAGTDANGEDHRDVVSDVTDAAADVAVDITNETERIAYCAVVVGESACRSVRFGDGNGCGWCRSDALCAYGNRVIPIGSCSGGWTW